MAKARVSVIRTVKKTKTSKKGNPRKCPTCGKFMGKK